MTFQGYLFHKENRKRKTPKQEKTYWIAILFMLMSVLILIFNEKTLEIEWVEYIFKTAAFLSLIVWFISRFQSFRTKEPLRGFLQGVIKININSIEIDSIVYDMEKVSNLELSIKNFSGKLVGGFYPGPQKSSGTDNNISFEFNNELIQHQFSIQTEKDFNNLKEIYSIIKENKTKKSHFNTFN